jgi:hypothetical protein
MSANQQTRGVQSLRAVLSASRGLLISKRSGMVRGSGTAPPAYGPKAVPCGAMPGKVGHATRRDRRARAAGYHALRMPGWPGCPSRPRGSRAARERRAGHGAQVGPPATSPQAGGPMSAALVVSCEACGLAASPGARTRARPRSGTARQASCVGTAGAKASRRKAEPGAAADQAHAAGQLHVPARISAARKRAGIIPGRGGAARSAAGPP